MSLNDTSPYKEGATYTFNCHVASVYPTQAISRIRLETNNEDQNLNVSEHSNLENKTLRIESSTSITLTRADNGRNLTCVVTWRGREYKKTLQPPPVVHCKEQNS